MAHGEMCRQCLNVLLTFEKYDLIFEDFGLVVAGGVRRVPRNIPPTIIIVPLSS